MALLDVRAGLTNTDAFREAPFHRGGHDGGSELVPVRAGVR